MKNQMLSYMHDYYNKMKSDIGIDPNFNVTKDD